MDSMENKTLKSNLYNCITFSIKEKNEKWENKKVIKISLGYFDI